MSKFFLIFLILLGMAALSACKKDSGPAASTTSRTDLLVAKSWRLSAQTQTFTSASFNNGTPIVTDEYATQQACERDNFLKFSANQTLVADEGPTKCSATDPQTQNGTWQFTNSDQTKISILDPSQSSVSVPFDVMELSATTLHVRTTYSYSSGGISATETEEYTFTAF